ncbi:class I SAM-dependent DNA methyltransferase [Marinomonas ostreistagni]|uniref:Class I SAM-dependent methyltransferase n=1 Tax=Marinomonas ostreistagni TaxID=359209 RepID=A0ABS0ZA42_9GAMM|nr:class I SAM-dependent methyltransferase [Marinomonas ostreistagni]MBJ7550073.1 class I SAM-dependent methyltransferase [Marinomonas ostreistagni]
MSETVLYTDLSAYYDLMCADINYQAQSDSIARLNRMFGNGGTQHLDLACGTGPHIRHFLDAGYLSQGLDLNQPMLDKAKIRCPEANFSLQNMCSFEVDQPVDLITCFLYSIHYCGDLEPLSLCIEAVNNALTPGGVFCFNAVDKRFINNQSSTAHSVYSEDSRFDFRSGWFYQGHGSQQRLRLSVQKTSGDQVEVWQDSHTMVAVDFNQLSALLEQHFEVHIFEHDYDKLNAWSNQTGNAIFVCIKR